jgi:hypothetical protein
VAADVLALAVCGLLHFAVLFVLSLPGRARPLTTGDGAFLVAFGTMYVVAAWAVTRRLRWGRWLAIAVSGLEAIPAAVLLYVLAVFSADPARTVPLREIGFSALILMPLVVLVIVWRHRVVKRD